MKPLISAILLGLSLGACTMERPGAEVQSKFHNPFAYPKWETETYAKNGQKNCMVTSGEKGLGVLVYRKENNDLDVLAKSERKLNPGMYLHVNINDHHYQTSQEFFSASESVRMVEDLRAGGKAYLEWSEPHPERRRRSHYILNLDGFNKEFEQCSQALRK